ncbi:MAG: chemotaxis protein CheD [Tateyamaria sp.]
MTEQTLHITQGEHAVGKGPDVVISTLLGSCVACCLWDPDAQVGGMNHMLLTTSPSVDRVQALSGINAMEMLINDMIKLGAARDRIMAKAFGGACMIMGLSDIGAQNARFTLSYLKQEAIPIVSHSLGGHQARNVRFWPGTGRAMQKLTDVNVRDVAHRSATKPGNGLELF